MCLLLALYFPVSSNVLVPPVSSNVVIHPVSSPLSPPSCLPLLSPSISVVYVRLGFTAPCSVSLACLYPFLCLFSNICLFDQYVYLFIYLFIGGLKDASPEAVRDAFLAMDSVLLQDFKTQQAGSTGLCLFSFCCFYSPVYWHAVNEAGRLLVS